MQLLLAISILCFVALIWVALSIARYVNASHRRGSAADEMPSIMPRSRKRESQEHDFKRALTKAIGQHEPIQPSLAEPIVTTPAQHVESYGPQAMSESFAMQQEPKLEQRTEFNLPQAQTRMESRDFPPVAEDSFIRANKAAANVAAPAISRPVAQPIARSSSEPDSEYHASIAARISQLQQRAAELQQNVHDISLNKGWNMPLKPLRPRTPMDRPDSVEVDFSVLRDERRTAGIETVISSKSVPAPDAVIPHPAPVEASQLSDTRCVVEAGTEALRKPPQALRRGVAERLDRAYAVNQDAGDLTDPYQAPRAGLNSGMTTTRQARS